MTEVHEEQLPQVEGIRRVRLSLLAAERANLTPGTPDGFVFDLYGSILTETVAAERIQAILVAYVNRAILQRRQQLVPQVDPKHLRQYAMTWRVAPALTAERLQVVLRETGTWLTERDLAALARFGGFILAAALDGKINKMLGAVMISNQLYGWWYHMCDMAGVPTT